MYPVAVFGAQPSSLTMSELEKTESPRPSAMQISGLDIAGIAMISDGGMEIFLWFISHLFAIVSQIPVDHFPIFLVHRNSHRSDVHARFEYLVLYFWGPVFLAGPFGFPDSRAIGFDEPKIVEHLANLGVDKIPFLKKSPCVEFGIGKRRQTSYHRHSKTIGVRLIGICIPRSLYWSNCIVKNEWKPLNNRSIPI